MKDFYYILGITSNATEDEIKKAYRKLSLKFHPDKNEGDKFFEERFKEIQEAYEILSHKHKRILYDSSFKNNDYTKNSLISEIISFEVSKNTVYNNDEIAIFWATKNINKLQLSCIDGFLEPTGKRNIKIKATESKTINITISGFDPNGQMLSKTIPILFKMVDGDDLKNNITSFNKTGSSKVKKVVNSFWVWCSLALILLFLFSLNKSNINSPTSQDYEIIRDENIPLEDYLNSFTYYLDLKTGYYIVNNGSEWRGRAGGGQKGGKWGLVNDQQQYVLPLVFDNIEKVYDQSLLILEKDGNYGFSDLEGKSRNEVLYDEISTFTNGGYYWIKKDGKWGVVDSTSRVIISPRFKTRVRTSVYNYENELTISSNYLVLNNVLINLETLKEITFNDFAFVSNVNCNTVIIQSNSTGLQYIYNLANKNYSFESKYIQYYEECFYSYSNRKPVNCSNLILNSSSGLVTSDGKIIINEGLYDGIQIISDKYIGVCNNCEIWGCGNATECACSLNNGEWGVVDKSGSQILNLGFNLETLENHLKENKDLISIRLPKQINNAKHLIHGQSPYAYCYGDDNDCSFSCSKIIVTASYNSDVIVLIKIKDQVFRNVYISKGRTYEFILPNGTYQPFFYYGSDWDNDKYMKETSCGSLYGGFLEDEIFGKDSPQFLNNSILTYELFLQKSGNFSTKSSNLNEAL